MIKFRFGIIFTAQKSKYLLGKMIYIFHSIQAQFHLLSLQLDLKWIRASLLCIASYAAITLFCVSASDPRWE